MTRAISCIVIIALSSGCSSPPSPTQLIVVVDTDLIVGREVDSVRFEVDSTEIDGMTRGADIDFARSRPATLSLVHQDGPLGPLVVTAAGLLEDAPVVTRTARVSFVQSSVKVLRLDLWAACRSVTCGEGQTCWDQGACRSVDVGESELIDWSGQIDALDSSVRDADVEQEADADVEQEMDADSDESECSPDAEEECNGRDDDCDGEIDEGFDLAFNANHCGRCGHACTDESPCVARACINEPVAVAAGEGHSCALTASGDIMCWGLNLYGQLGDGTTEERAGVVSAIDPAGPAIALSAGANHTCAVLMGEEGHVVCWGSGESGELGDGSAVGGPGPVVPYLPLPAIDISAGDEHTCAIVEGGEVYCWGKGGAGRLGTGDDTSRYAPVLVSGDHRFIQISAGAQHTCGVSNSNEVFCWGRNNVHQVGGVYETYEIPRMSLESGQAIQVAAGAGHTCALAPDGGIACWGHGDRGQLGHGEVITSTPDPVEVSDLEGVSLDAIWLTAGYDFTCAVMRDGHAICWGRQDDFQVGNGDETGVDVLSPDFVEGELVFLRLTAGLYHTCGHDLDGTIFCWGRNSANQVTSGSQEARSSPTSVAGF